MNLHTFYNSKKQNKAQSIAEYSIFLAMVAVVLVGVILGPFRDSLGNLFHRLMQSVTNSLSIW